MFILKRFKSRARMAKWRPIDYDLIRSYSKGKFSYVKFQKLKLLAMHSIGYETDSDLILLNESIQTYESLSSTLETIEHRIIELMKDIPQTLTSIPGVTLMSSANIIAEVGDFRNFSTPAQVISFAGLDSSIHQSGTSETKGHLVKRGSSLLRATLWQVTFSALRYIPVLYDYYQKKKAEGKHHKVALTHCTRKLTRVIYNLGYHQLSFDQTQFR